MEPEFRVVLQPNDAARPDKHFRAYADAEQFANAEVNSGRADRASIYEHGANNRLVRSLIPGVGSSSPQTSLPDPGFSPR